MKEKINFSPKTTGVFDIEDSCANALRQAFLDSSRIGVACSGGADSVFLLYLIVSMAGKENRRNLRVLHFNHKARENAEIDEVFVKNLCEKLEVELIVGSPINPPLKLTEEAFRNMRMDFFQAKSKELHLNLIAQGHHAGDVAETIIMRLMKGAGLDGLCAPRAISKLADATFVRPLLNLTKSQITESLVKSNIAWREDESNADDKFMRNKIRNLLLGQIQNVCEGDFIQSACRSRRLLDEDAVALEDIYKSLRNEANPQDEPLSENNLLILSEKMLSQSSFVRRALMEVLTKANLIRNLRGSAIDTFVRKVKNGKTFKMSAGDKFVYFDARQNSISVETSQPPMDFDIPLKIGKNVLPNGDIIEVSRVMLGTAKRNAILAGENDDNFSSYISIEAVGELLHGSLCVRSRRNADAYQPFGASSKKKIKDILDSKKIISIKRKSILIVYNKKGEIVWAPSLPPAQKYKIASTGAVIELTYTPNSVTH